MKQRWRSADDLGYRPAALGRFTAASLQYLYLAAYPRTSTSPAIVSRSGNGWSDTATPDAARAKYRRHLKRILADIDRLAAKALDLAEDRPEVAPRRGWRCGTCRTGQRPQARWCDQCGAQGPAKA